MVSRPNGFYHNYYISSNGFSDSNIVTLLDANTHAELFSIFNIIECYEHYINPIIKNNKTSGISEYITIAKKID